VWENLYHFYFFGNPEAGWYSTGWVQVWCSRSPGTIERKVVTGATVSEIHTPQGQIDFLSYQLGDAAKNVPLGERNAALNKSRGAEEEEQGSYRDTMVPGILFCGDAGRKEQFR